MAASALAMALMSLLSEPLAGEGQDTSNRLAVDGWRDDFDGVGLDTSRWINVDGYAPGYRVGVHLGYYDPTHVTVRDGMLTIALTQAVGLVDGETGVISTGGLVSSRKTYRYGTYEWRMRMSSTATAPGGPGSPVAGSVSAGFTYVNNSRTEIDFEFTGTDPLRLHMSNWLNSHPRRDPTWEQQTSSNILLPDLTSTFKTYRFVWDSEGISYYVDDELQSVHTENVPKAAAYFMTNHWGTDGPWWGGLASVGTDRYAYVDWVQFTPGGR